MKSFFDTAHCKSGVHCAACRRDRTWRATIAERYDVGPAGADFACPGGVWTRALRRAKLGTKIARATTAVGIKPCGGCIKRKALLDGQ